MSIVGTTLKLAQGIVVGTIAVMAGMNFNGFLNSLLQMGLPVGERDLNSQSQVATFQFLLFLLLLVILVMFNMFC